ncbi:MAG: cytochrome c oxidase cbb3-type subunit 3 [Paraglaciecola sp.]|jgi:cytochrome c oxidase cbb3-type subunit 3
MKIFFKTISVLFLSLATIGTGAAQAGDTSGGMLSNHMVEITLGLALLVSLIVLLVLVVVLSVLKTFVKVQREDKMVAAGITANEVSDEPSAWKNFVTSLTKSVPVDQEEDVLTDHEYDGIRELDNRLPPWWTAMFYATIVFGIAYLLHFMILGTGPSQDEEYVIEMAEAEEQIQIYQSSLALSIDENSVTFTEDPVALADGEKIFISQCAACHANDGGGGIGPNMTDEYWIHGGSINDIFSIIKNGVAQKGMISWKAQLTPEQMQNVSSYILTLQGSTPASPKDPQGELYETEEKKVTADETSLSMN